MEARNPQALDTVHENRKPENTRSGGTTFVYRQRRPLDAFARLRRYRNKFAAAHEYALRGWAVFPCAPGTKLPFSGTNGFKDATVAAEQIGDWWNQYPQANIAIATGNLSGIWALDIDPQHGGDASLERLVAQHGDLPKTVAQSTPSGGTHYLFRCPPNAEIRNSASRIAPGIDVRGDGGYILVAPSEVYGGRVDHRTYEWLVPPEAVIAEAPDWLLAVVTKAEKVTKRSGGESQRRRSWDSARPYLKKAIENIITKLAETPEGARNHTLFKSACALGRLVGGGGLSRAQAETYLREAAAPLFVEEPAKSEETMQRGLDEGIKEPQAPPGETPDDIDEEFNHRYAIVNEAGKAMVYRRTRDPILDRLVLERIKFSDLRNLYLNRPVTVTLAGKSLTKTAAEWWLRSPERRQYLDGVAFDPTNNLPPSYWNLWQGWPIEPVPGDWSRMKEHIRTVICKGDQKLFDYVMGWMASLFQFPAKQGEVALVLRGAKGTGKGTLGHALRRAWGQHGMHISNSKHLTGNFNAHLRDCVLLFADEALFAADRQHESVLKALITEPTITIEGKYQNAVLAPNMLHVIMASNSDWVVPSSSDERRYCVIDVCDSRQGDKQYFKALYDELEERDGLAAMIYDLLHRPLEGFDVREVPRTSALEEQALYSMNSLELWWTEVLQRGFVWVSRRGSPIFSDWHEFATTELLSNSYKQWAATNRRLHIQTRVELGKMMSSMYRQKRPSEAYPVSEPQDSMAPPYIAKANKPGYVLGPLDSARDAFARLNKLPSRYFTG